MKPKKKNEFKIKIKQKTKTYLNMRFMLQNVLCLKVPLDVTEKMIMKRKRKQID